MYVVCTHCTGNSSIRIELTECDEVNDWQLFCPNNCESVDDSLRNFIASPEQDRIAVWGDHEPIWTGEGREGLKLLVGD